MEGEALKAIVEHYQARGISVSELCRSTNIVRSKMYDLFRREKIPTKDLQAVLGFYGMKSLSDKMPEIAVPEGKPNKSTKTDSTLDKRIKLYEDLIETKDELIHTLQEQVAEYRTQLKRKNEGI